MLRRITRDQVRLGMYLERLEGSWLRHPFWRSRFLLTDATDLTKLLDSDVATLIIDDEKGIGIATQPLDASIKAVTTQPQSASPRPRSKSDHASASETEKAEAVKNVNRSKKVMRRIFDGARLGKAVRSEDVLGVVEEISASIQRNPLALINVVRLKSKDEYTYLHSVAVCALMVSFARHLGYSKESVQKLGVAGLLHDIGKMTVSSLILNKPGHLSDEEFALVRSHPEQGFELLSGGEGIPEVALEVCRHHHEKMDGTGYPHRLRAEQISIAARMGAICDVYDALTSNRAYKDAWTPVQAVSEMMAWTGQFDPTLLFKFMQSIAVFPVGMLVRLRSNRLAITLDNGRRASRPKVRAFYATTEREWLEPVDVIITDSLADDQIVAHEEPGQWGIEDWQVVRERLLGSQSRMAA